MFYISHLLFQITGLQEDVIESQKSATPDDFGHLARDGQAAQHQKHLLLDSQCTRQSTVTPYVTSA